MTNLSINFSYPWLLILIIPAILMTLVPYFRMNKRYRRTRNRITSMVLHIIIMVLAISVLSGVTVAYDLPNEENEVIILVDASFSNTESEVEKNDFLQTVIQSNGGDFKLGIVTFGYDQVYAVELTNDMRNVYTDYLRAPLPDDSATDIEAALKYTAGLFTNPDGGRIVLVTDAVETDGVANNVIKSIAADGVTVDTVYFRNNRLGDEVQIIGMERPEEKIKVGEPFEVNLVLQSSFAGVVSIVPYDNGAAGKSMDVEVVNGIQNVKIPFEFAVPGMHEMYFEITCADDTLDKNNIFYSYIYIESFNNILVVESNDAESEAICRMLDDEKNVTVVHVGDTERFPKTINQLRAYDEVIICNISNEDMPEGFADILYSYVYDFGGGLFTVCGNELDSNPGDEEWTANAYTKEDMYGTKYQEMLPVDIIEYTPPVAVMILVDVSGSMWEGPDNPSKPLDKSKLYAAMQGAEACLDVLSERDYVGVIALNDDYHLSSEIIPRTQRDKILAAIGELPDQAPGGTIYSKALSRAGTLLRSVSDVEKRHIILITDGEPASTDEELYKAVMQENAAAGITTSIVGIQCTAAASSKMKNVLVQFAGVEEKNFHDVTDITRVPDAIREDLSAPEIKDINYETFQPIIKATTAITKGIAQEDMPELDGFYGMKAKENSEVILMGKYTPVYTQWQFGKGMVGTFACDLSGVWSSNFVDTEEGTQIVNNIVNTLLPKENIRVQDIGLEVEGDNYRTQLNIFTELAEGQTLEVRISSPAAEGSSEKIVQTLTADASEGYTKMSFDVKTAGIHEILAQKKDASGAVISETVVYKALAYSKEYDCFTDSDAAMENAALLAKNGRGALLSEAWEVYESVAQFLHKVIDPKLPFIIAVIVMLLMDIAVRKFKWKWPHEIIRERKARQAMSVNNR
jgi:uncharacterized membrane protein